MQNRNRFSQNAASRWGGEGQFNQGRGQRENGASDNFYPENVGRYRETDQRHSENRAGNRNNPQPGEQGFGGGDYYGGAHSYGRRNNYGQSSISGGGGGFGSPSDYGAGGSGGNYSGGYYGSSGSYSGGGNYRGGSSYAGGGNYSDGPGAAYGYNQPMPGYDDSSQESYNSRTGYRSNYVSANYEFDAVMEDPMTSSNYMPERNPHRNSYRDYNYQDNYGSMQGPYSDYNNYTGRTDYNNRGGARFENGRSQEGFYRQENDNNWLKRAETKVKNWFNQRGW